MPDTDYHWNYADGAPEVTAAAAGLTYQGRIQNDDGRGGYNTDFTVDGSLERYHVHFKAGGALVNVVRYKAGAHVEGDNVIKIKDRRNPSSLRDMIGWCRDYPNHRVLLTQIKEAIRNVERNGRQELT